MKDLKTILCIDWGTSSFRGTLVDSDSQKIIRHFHTDQGCKKLFKESSDKRVSPLDYFIQRLRQILSNEGLNPTDFDQIFISGMASSSIGMRELPYATLPFPIDGSRVVSDTFHINELGRVTLISGVAADEDIMRGEETQCIGLKEEMDHEKSVLILPGTHSKHMEIRKGQLVGFRTYLTGELFQLISEQSILSQSLEKVQWTSGFADSLEQGVKDARKNHLLNDLFRIRARDILGKSRDSQKNFFYLSGLLIGTELQDLKRAMAPLFFACDHKMKPLYELAAQHVALPNFTFLDPDQLSNAYIFGQLSIIKNQP